MTVAIRDKGPIPLDAPDGKPATAYDPRTGYVAAAFIDLQHKKFALWWQPQGWIAVRQSYGALDLTGWTGMVHDGAFKLLAKTWQDNRFVVIELAQLY